LNKIENGLFYITEAFQYPLNISPNLGYFIFISKTHLFVEKLYIAISSTIFEIETDRYYRLIFDLLTIGRYTNFQRYFINILVCLCYTATGELVCTKFILFKKKPPYFIEIYSTKFFIKVLNSKLGITLRVSVTSATILMAKRAIRVLF